MFQEEKDLLPKHLCARLPYGVVCNKDKELWLYDLCSRVPFHPKGHIVNACNGSMCDEWLTCATINIFTNITNNCRLYLRPMSSMTEEEKEEFENLLEGIVDGIERWDKPDLCEEYDWLNAHHFDYRGLIEKGLALEAPKDMYKS